MLKNKKGFISIEAIMVGTVILLTIYALIGVFIYVYPTFELQREVHLLGKVAQINGGIPDKELNEFKNKINKISFVKKSGKAVIIEAKTTQGNDNAIGVTNSKYISKSSGNVINVVVKIPSNNSIIKSFTSKNTDYYTFKTSVMSEKY